MDDIIYYERTWIHTQKSTRTQGIYRIYAPIISMAPADIADGILKGICKVTCT